MQKSGSPLSKSRNGDLVLVAIWTRKPRNKDGVGFAFHVAILIKRSGRRLKSGKKQIEHAKFYSELFLAGEILVKIGLVSGKLGQAQQQSH